MPQVTEDSVDEEFLFDNYPRYQCSKIYYPGESFGEIALMTQESRRQDVFLNDIKLFYLENYINRMASIICKNDCWFMALNREGFAQIQGTYQQHILNTKAFFLQGFEIFKPVTVNKILSFLHQMKESEFSLGSPIYQQGDNLEEVYFILEGEVEIVHQFKQPGISKLSKHQYEIYFRNTRMANKQKQIVLLNKLNYFGDEDIFSQGLVRNYSAICKTQFCRLLHIDIRKLVSFLKVYQQLTIFKDIANLKWENYMLIIQKDVLMNKLVLQEIAEQINRPNNFTKTTDLDDEFFSFPQCNELKNPKEIKNQNVCIPTKIETPNPLNQGEIRSPRKDSSDKPSQKIDDNIQQQQSTALLMNPKIHNVFYHQYNRNILSMKHNKYNHLKTQIHSSTCMFTLSDVPMTTTMNTHPDDLRRIEYRIRKNISSSLERKVRMKAMTSRNSPAKQSIGYHFDQQEALNSQNQLNYRPFSLDTFKSLTRPSIDSSASLNRSHCKLNVSPLKQSDCPYLLNQVKSAPKKIIFPLILKEKRTSSTYYGDNEKQELYFTPKLKPERERTPPQQNYITSTHELNKSQQETNSHQKELILYKYLKIETDNIADTNQSILKEQNVEQLKSIMKVSKEEQCKSKKDKQKQPKSKMEASIESRREESSIEKQLNLKKQINTFLKSRNKDDLREQQTIKKDQFRGNHSQKQSQSLSNIDESREDFVKEYFGEQQVKEEYFKTCSRMRNTGLQYIDEEEKVSYEYI